MEFGYRPEIQIEKGVQKNPIIDMDSVLKRVPLIEGVFSPDEEVEKLWSVPKTERRKAVALFRDKLARQREAWALCRTSIEERIESNPDLSKEEMTRIINEFAPHYGFAKKDIEVAKSLVDDYTEMRKRVVGIRREFPDDIALINRLTGLNFTKDDAKDFKVSVGPISIEISCSGFNASRIYEKGSAVCGFASQSDDAKPIYYLVINNDYPTKNPNYYDATTVHEREHLKNRILAPKLYGTKEIRADAQKKLNKNVLMFLRNEIGEKLLGFKKNFEDEVIQRYELAKNPKEKVFYLTEFMRLEREDAFNRVKNEIIAMKADNYKRNNYNIFLRQDGGDYDYLADIRDVGEKQDDKLWQKIAQKVLVEEYGKIIDNAIYAFDNLKKNGYSSKEAIAILSDKRLPDWPKTVKRILEEKMKRLIEEKK